MATLQVIAIIALILLGYSIAWEAVRYVRMDRAQQPVVERGLVALIAFVIAAALWPLVLVAFLVKYRTPWPVSGGRLVPPNAV